MGQVYLMTDKDETKDCPCTYPGCDNVCRVNKFYTPSKAKCPPHGGSAYVRVPVAKGEDAKIEFVEHEPTVVGQVTSEPKRENRNLEQMMCPNMKCGHPLEIAAVSDSLRHVTFTCRECSIAVEISYDWRHMQMTHVPEPLRPVVKEFNKKQVLAALTLA